MPTDNKTPETVEEEIKGSVLVDDDNPLIINVLKGLLASEKLEVHCTLNGKDAMGVLSNTSVDVIICDVMMPELNGYQLHEMVRNNVDLAHISFIFLTALGEENEVSKGKEMGADDYIIKPFDPKKLLSLVKGKITRSKNLKVAAQKVYDSYRRKVIHTLSHEFRTPLVAINTGTELLIDQGGVIDQQKSRQLLEAIQRGGRRLEKLVGDFMLLQQLEAGLAGRLVTQRSAKRKVSDLLQLFVEGHQDLVEKEGGTLICLDESGDVEIYIYEPHVLDILARLVGNSLKFKVHDKTIELHVYVSGDDVYLEVWDRGVGIDPAKMKEAINPFGQINRDKMEQQGGGLGLAIASQYASLNKGRLIFRSREGGGAIVGVMFSWAKD